MGFTKVYKRNPNSQFDEYNDEFEGGEKAGTSTSPRTGQAPAKKGDPN